MAVVEHRPGPVDTSIIDNTGDLHPDGPRPPSANPKVAKSKSFLQSGTSADAVGNLVLDAIRANRLYIHTDRTAVEPIERRTRALLDAIPEA